MDFHANKEKLLKMFLILFGIVIFVAALRFTIMQNSQTLSDYAKKNPEALSSPSEAGSESLSSAQEQAKQDKDDTLDTLNENALTKANIRKNPGLYFYGEAREQDLVLLHVVHYDFEGDLKSGELLCNKAIANDLLEIFYELYQKEYQISKLMTADVYEGDAANSWNSNNSCCYYDENTSVCDSGLHLQGLAVDINPVYNPYICYEAKDFTASLESETSMGDSTVYPQKSKTETFDTTDRSANFPYKIDSDDLCYKTFLAHGFTWGGDWNGQKSYMHFQKNVE